MKLKLKTLTPVHISTGNDLEPFDYLIKDEDFYRISLAKAIDVISEEVPDAPQQFSEWLDKELFRFEAQKNTQHHQANRGQSKIRREINFGVFCRGVLKKPGLVDKLIKSAVVYKMPLPFGMVNNTQVNEQLKSSDNLPYIPGTSIKGAVRTALAANAWMKLTDNERARITQNTKRSMGQFYPKRYYKEKDEYLMELLFSCRTTDNSKSDSARFSIFKFFHFSDAHIIPSDQKETMQANPVFLYLKDKAPQPQTNIQETISPGSILEFDLIVDTNGLWRAYKESKAGTGIWLDLEMKLERLFEVKLSEIKKDELEKKVIEGIFSVLNKQATLTFERDLKWMDGLRYFTQKNGIAENTIKRISSFFTGGIPGEGGTLKTGWGSGFLSTTIFHSIKQTDEPFVKEMFHDLKIGEARQKPGYGNQEQQSSPTNLNHFPKTRRMTAQQLLIPDSVLGWIQIAENFSTPVPGDVKTDTVETRVVEAPKVDTEAIIAGYLEANQKLKLKEMQKMYARVVRSEAPMVVCEILHPNLPGEFKARYPAGLPEGSFVLLNVNFIKSGIIQNVSIAKALV
ncbi:hypothetical protein MASR2M39_28990 [Ignavibacteriales bacterium]